MDTITVVFSIAILIMSVVIHELSHGYTADLLGDPTPRLQGRLTLNPLKHLEFFGSFLVPLLTSFTGFMFGWAKPVEWNPYNVKNRRVGEFLISAAGPASNFLSAIVFSIFVNFFSESVPKEFIQISVYVITINIALAVFNLIPIPPLDGSKIVFSMLPPRFLFIREFIERYSLILFFFVIFFLWKFIQPLVLIIFKTLLNI